MRKWIILVILLLIIAGAVVLALSNLNSYLNNNRELIAQQAEAAIGRRVQFDEVGVSLSGGLGASITNLSVTDDPEFSDGNFLRVGKAQVLIKLLPALRGRYEVGRVVLNEPEITVIQTKDGFNFDSIGKTTGKLERGEDKPKEAPAPGSGPPPVAGIPLLVGKISIENGKVRFIDRTAQPPSDVSIDHLDLTASDLSPSTPMKVDFAAALLGATKPNLTIEGSIGPLDLLADSTEINLDLDATVGPLVLDDLKQVKAIANVLPAELSSPDPITLNINAKGTSERLQLHTSFDGTGASIRYGDMFRKPKGTPFRLNADAKREDETIDVEKATLTLASLDVAAKGSVKPGTPTSLDLNLNAKASSLSGWDELLPALEGIDVDGTLNADLRARGNVGGGKLPQLDGNVGLRDVRASGTKVPVKIDGLTSTLALKGNSLELPPTKFNVAGLPVELKATVSDFEKPAAKVALRAAELKLAALGFGADGVKKDEALRDLTFDGSVQPSTNGANVQATLKSSGGTLRDLEYQNLDVELTTRDNVASLRQLSFNAYGGTFRGRAEYDMRKKDKPSFEVRSDVRDMDLAQLLASQGSKAAGNVQGKLRTDITLSGSGKDWPAISRSMRGNGELAVKDGALKDINIADSALSSLTGIAGLSNFISPRVRSKYPQLFGTSDTPFDQLGGTFQVAGGRATTNDLVLSARDYAVNGKGYFTFEQQVDFAATLVASEMLTKDIVDDVKEARYLTGSSGRLEIPFQIEGTLPNARPKPDSKFIANALQRAIVGKGLDALFKKGKKKNRDDSQTDGAPRKANPTEELIKKGLDGLFGR